MSTKDRVGPFRDYRKFGFRDLVWRGVSVLSSHGFRRGDGFWEGTASNAIAKLRHGSTVQGWKRPAWRGNDNGSDWSKLPSPTHSRALQIDAGKRVSFHFRG